MGKLQYVGDFETSTELWVEKDTFARVWASCLVTIEENPQVKHLSNNIDDFMNFVFKKECDVFFHNLRFDGHYILSWLFENGYTYSKERLPKTFQTLITNMNVWYELKVTHSVKEYGKDKKKKYNSTVFKDSLKKINMSVNAVAKAYGMKENKLSIDYDVYRPIGYVLTPHEEEYIKLDCVIVAKALNTQFNEGLIKMTTASDSLNMFKNNEIYGIQKSGFEYLFPELSLPVDNDIRLSYRGGYTYVNPLYTNTRNECISFDVNSLYPSVMYGLHGSLPYGFPEWFTGAYIPDKKYPLYIISLSCCLKLKEGYIPTIQIKNNPSYSQTEYLTNANFIDLTLTNVDYEMMIEHYEVTNIEYVGGYKFMCKINMFKPYIDFWNAVKTKATIEGNKGLRAIAKLMLNALYGKFASNPLKQSKYPTLVNGVIKMVFDEVETGTPIYTAVSSFITARARAFTIKACQSNIERFIYTDTDSLYLKGTEIPTNINIDDSKLGFWKCEGVFSDSLFLRSKTYIKTENDVTSITCAGLPDRAKEKIYCSDDDLYHSFTYGSVFGGKLKPKVVKGGVILVETNFTIKSLK